MARLMPFGAVHPNILGEYKKDKQSDYLYRPTRGAGDRTTRVALDAVVGALLTWDRVQTAIICPTAKMCASPSILWGGGELVSPEG